MPLIFPSNTLSDAGYDVENSVRLDDAAYMHKTQSGGNRQIFTMSCWTKLTGGYGGDGGSLLSTDGTDDDSNFHFGIDNGGASGGATDSLFLHIYGADGFTTTPLLRDYSAWYHIVLAVDTTQSTSSNRMKLYVNNVQQTLAEGGDYPAQDDNFGVNESGTVLGVGTHPGSTSAYALNSYLAEYCLIDGQQLTPSSFGEANEDSPTIWQPIDPSDLTFGTNGFYLDFKDSANLGNDANGGTDLTEVNLDATDQATDSPSNNFATYNPLINTQNVPTFAEGNTQAATTSSGVNGGFSSIGVANGKWYVEFKLSAHSGTNRCILGVTSDPAEDDRNNEYLGQTARSYSYSAELGKKVNNNTASTYGDSYTTDDILGVALDLTNLKLYFSKNGTWQDSGDPTSGATGTGAAFTVTAPASTDTGFYFFAEGDESGSHSVTVQANFGNPAYAITSGNADADGYGNFEYAVPSGYFALNTKNLGAYGG